MRGQGADPEISPATRVSALDERIPHRACPLFGHFYTGDILGQAVGEIDVDEGPAGPPGLQQPANDTGRMLFGGRPMGEAAVEIGLLAECDGRYAEDGGLHRRRAGARVGNKLAHVAAAIDPRQDEVRFAILQGLMDPHQHAVRRCPFDRVAPGGQAPQPDRIAKRQRMSRAALFVERRANPDIVAEFARDPVQHLDPRCAHPVIIRYQDAQLAGPFGELMHRRGSLQAHPYTHATPPAP